MARGACCEKMGLKKGPWKLEEDQILVSFIQRFGHGNWRALPKQAGLLRCGKSCRLRWTNYLRPDIKRGNFSEDEDEVIIKLHQVLGNRWSAIAARLEGRTDNEIKNYWHTRLKKRLINKQQNLTTTTIRAHHDHDHHMVHHINDARISNPDVFTTHQRIQSPHNNTPISVEGTDASSSSSSSSSGGTFSATHEDGSNDMEFWYDIFMNAGNDNSIEVQDDSEQFG